MDLNCQQNAKTLNLSENIPQSFRGATIFRHPVYSGLVFSLCVRFKSYFDPQTKVHDTHSNKLRQLMAQLSCAIKLLQQLHNCVSNKLPKQTCSHTDMDASQLLLLAASFYSPSIP